MRIDAHQHFWNYEPERDRWITEDMSVLRRSFGPDDLRPLLQRHGFDGCVAVQSEPTESGNQYLLQLAADHSWVKGVVGWIDPTDPHIEEQLAHYRSLPLLKGFRYMLQGEADTEFMLRPDFVQGLRLFGRLGFTFDLLIQPRHLRPTRALLRLCPGQPFVIDHLAKPFIRDGRIGDWKREMQALSGFPDLHCKVSGLVTEADWQHWKKEDLVPYLEVAVEAFGPGRLLFGSDWPVCLLAATYEGAVEVVTDYFASFSAAERQAIFGGNAARFYHLTSNDHGPSISG